MKDLNNNPLAPVVTTTRRRTFDDSSCSPEPGGQAWSACEGDDAGGGDDGGAGGDDGGKGADDGGKGGDDGGKGADDGGKGADDGGKGGNDAGLAALEARFAKLEADNAKLRDELAKAKAKPKPKAKDDAPDPDLEASRKKAQEAEDRAKAADARVQRLTKKSLLPNVVDDELLAFAPDVAFDKDGKVTPESEKALIDWAKKKPAAYFNGPVGGHPKSGDDDELTDEERRRLERSGVDVDRKRTPAQKRFISRFLGRGVPKSRAEA